MQNFIRALLHVQVKILDRPLGWLVDLNGISPTAVHA